MVMGWGGRKPNPPQRLSQGSYLRAACILDPTLSLASAPFCYSRMGNHRASLGADSFLEPHEGPFHPTQGSCLVLRGLDFSVGGKEEKILGGEVMDESHGHRSSGALLTLLCGRPSTCAFKLEWERHDPGPSILFPLALSTPPGSWQEVRT